MTGLVHAPRATVPPRMWLGSWVADCLLCGANKVRPYQPGFACVGCGRRYDMDWPSSDMVEGVARLLMMRPNYANRNWGPGETLHQLIFENAAHGIFDQVEGELGQSVLTVGDDRILLDQLPAQVAALPAAFTRKAVGS